MHTYSYHNYRRGFTFLELLLALAILAIGLTHIFRIFFGSIDALVHIKHRMDALLILDNARLDALRAIHQKNKEEQRVIDKKEGEYPSFRWTATLGHWGTSQNLYTVDTEISWQEKSRDVTMSRQVYLRKLP